MDEKQRITKLKELLNSTIEYGRKFNFPCTFEEHFRFYGHKTQAGFTSNNVGYAMDEQEKCTVKEEIDLEEHKVYEMLKQSSDSKTNELEKHKMPLENNCVVMMNRLPFVCANRDFLCISQGCYKSFSSSKVLA